MSKKVKRFVLFMFFGFMSSLLSGGKEAHAANNLCIIPKNADGKLIYHGSVTDIDAASIECVY